MPFPFNILVVLVVAWATVDASARILSPRKYRAFLVWMNRRKSYAGQIRNALPSDRNIRLVGLILFLFVTPYYWNVLTRQRLWLPMPWAAFLFGLALVVGGTITFVKPGILFGWLRDVLGVEMRFPEDEILKGSRIFAGGMVAGGLLLVLGIVFRSQ